MPSRTLAEIAEYHDNYCFTKDIKPSASHLVYHLNRGEPRCHKAKMENAWRAAGGGSDYKYKGHTIDWWMKFDYIDIIND